MPTVSKFTVDFIVDKLTPLENLENVASILTWRIDGLDCTTMQKDVLLFYEIILVSFNFIFTFPNGIIFSSLNPVPVPLKHEHFLNKPSPLDIKKLIPALFNYWIYCFELTVWWLSSYQSAAGSWIFHVRGELW